VNVRRSWCGEMLQRRGSRARQGEGRARHHGLLAPGGPSSFAAGRMDGCGPPFSAGTPEPVGPQWAGIRNFNSAGWAQERGAV
jgi:hypothetical protein